MTEPTAYKISNKKLLIAFVIAFVFNLFFMVYHFNQTGAENLDGTYSEAGDTQLMLTAVLGLLITIPLVCLILSLLIALFVNRSVPYGSRFTRVFLWTLFLVNAIMVLRVLIDLLLGV